MADVITRFKLETTQFDSKLRDSAKSLTDLTHHLTMAGKDFNRFAQQHVEAAKALGKTTSGATNLKDKLKDLVGAYNQVARSYNTLTEEQKKTDFGKAMAESLQKLQGQIRETKSELNTVPGVLDSLTSKLTVNIDALSLMNATLDVAKGAWNVYKSVIESTEGTADQYAIVQEQLNASVNSFFRNINEGSFANFLQGLSDVAQRAKDAYEAMDELASYAVRYNPKNQVDMQRIDKLLKEARALTAKGDKEGAAAKTAEAKAVAEQAKINTRAYGQKEYDAGVNTLRSLLGGTGVTYSNKQLEYYSDPANWEKIKTAANEYGVALSNLTKAEKELANAGMSGNQKMIDAANKRYQAAKRDYDAQSASNRRAYNYLNTRDGDTEEGEAFIRATQQIYGKQMAEYAVDSIQARIERIDATVTKPTGGTPRSGAKEVTSALKIDEFGNVTISTTESMKELQAQLAKYKQQLASATNMFDAGEAQANIERVQQQIKAQPLALSIGWDTESVAGLQDNFDELLEDMRMRIEDNPLEISVNLNGVQELVDGGKEVTSAWSNTATVIRSVGSALNGIEKPSAKIASIIAQTIATIALSYSQTLAQDKASKSNIWGFIAAASAAMVSMATSIASVKKATAGNYAEGGIVPGNSFSGDNLRTSDYGINSGELILNRAQQNSISAQLQYSDNNSMNNRTPYVSGEQIYLVLNNYLRRTGRGELLTARG